MNKYNKKLSWKLIAQYFLSLAASAALFALLGLLCTGILATFDFWRNDPFLARFFYACRNYILGIYLFCLIISWIWCSMRLISRLLGYLDELVEAAELLARPDSGLVSLSTDLADAQDYLNQVRDRTSRAAWAAREAEQRKNDLIVYLAHDLKTPLTSVIGYLTLLRDEPGLSPAFRARYTGVALDKAQRLEDLINEFFDITRFNLTHLELEKRPCDLTRMLQQIASEFQPQFSEKNLSCRLDLPPVLEYGCDPDKLARVFDNLMRNAFYYSFPDTQVEVSARWELGDAVIRFVNQGPSIPPEKLERIFEQFFRLDSSRASHTGGAGLGLAIAKEIAELHGGSIRADSAAGRTAFTVRLPLSSGQPEPDSGKEPKISGTS